jgi:hypothetical protein
MIYLCFNVIELAHNINKNPNFFQFLKMISLIIKEKKILEVSHIQNRN